MATIIVVSGKNHKLILKVVAQCLINRTFTWFQSMLLQDTSNYKGKNSKSAVRNLADCTLPARVPPEVVPWEAHILLGQSCPDISPGTFHLRGILQTGMQGHRRQKQARLGSCPSSEETKEMGQTSAVHET